MCGILGYNPTTSKETSITSSWMLSISVILQRKSLPSSDIYIYIYIYIYICIDQQNKLQTTLFRKSSDRQNFLNAKSENPYSLMKSIPYSQAVQIWRICSTFQDYHNHSRKLIEKFVNKGYKKVVAIQQIQKVEQLDKKQLLYQEKFKRYSNKTLAHTYYSHIAFRKNTSLKQIIGTNIIHNN